MHDIAFDLLILLTGIWLVAVTLRPLGLPTIMGELIVGVLVGPAVLGWIEPSEAITLLADIGIFFLMFHAGVETQPRQFFDALKRSLGVALVGAAVPFSVSFGVATLFGLDPIAATFVGLTMTATAVVITLKTLQDLGLADTRVARVIVASCVIDDLLTLVFFGLIVGVLSGGSFQATDIAVTLFKVTAFFVLAGVLGRYIYPSLTLPFRSKGGKGFTFILLVAIAAGLFAELIGLHMIIGAYLAGLFFEEKVAHPNLVRVVADRSYGIAYSFLGPIFFISLGFSITFDISGTEVGFLAMLTGAVIVGQIVSAGGMARRMGLPAAEALTVGVGMCGRAELAFILASLALAQGAIDATVFSVLIFTSFLLNLFTPMALKGCSILLAGKATRSDGGGPGVLLSQKFDDGDGPDSDPAELPMALRGLDDAVVIYCYGPEVAVLVDLLERRGTRYLIVEEDETRARTLHQRELSVAHVVLAEQEVDLHPLARARSLILNGDDDDNVLVALGAREAGFEGQIVAMIDNPARRSAVRFAGADVTFAPTHMLAAALASRVSSRISPLVEGMQPLRRLLEVSELRVHEDSPLAHSTLAKTELRTRTGVHVVGQWLEGTLSPAPGPNEALQPGTILVAAGTPENIERLSELTHPVREAGIVVLVGQGALGRKIAEILRAVDEPAFVVGEEEGPSVDLVGDIGDADTLDQLPLSGARAVLIALPSESANLFAATVLRDHAPGLPIVAGTQFASSVARVQRAGVDYALSVSQVAGQILTHHVLGETVSMQPRIKLARVSAAPLEGKHPLSAKIRERTGCTVVAVERNGEVGMEMPEGLRLTQDDALYICGTTDAIGRFKEMFSTEWL